MKSRDRIDPAHLEQARQVADAILYEGYLLYPYRASAQKNQERFQFGVLMPAAYRAVDEHEPSAAQTECVLEGPADAHGHGAGPVPPAAAAHRAGGLARGRVP